MRQELILAGGSTLMEFAIIGINSSNYADKILERLLSFRLTPKYVIIEDHNTMGLAASAFYIDNRQLPKIPQDLEKWGMSSTNKKSLALKCNQETIPFFLVPDHNSRQTRSILSSHPIDILLITEGPIIRGPILYMPRYCVMNIHAAPLPQYRGNWTTRFALYHDEPPTVSAHVVTPWIDEGPIIKIMQYEIKQGDTLEEIDKKAQIASADLAAYSLLSIVNEGFSPKIQRVWEGKEYKGIFKDGHLEPAMPLELQEELKERLHKGEYGFYAK